MSDEFEDNVGEDTFDDFEESKPTLGSMWQSNPMFKMAVVGGVVVLIFVAVSFMGGDEFDDLPEQDSVVPTAPDVTTVPGTEEATPAYIDAIEQQNEQDLEIAQATGGSVLPVPIDPPVGVIGSADSDEDGEDPLQRWRRLQEERLQREMRQREQIQSSAVAVNPAERAEVVSDLASHLQSQMSSILDTKESSGIQTMNVTEDSFLSYIQKKRQEEQSAGYGGSGGFDDGSGDGLGGDGLGGSGGGGAGDAGGSGSSGGGSSGDDGSLGDDFDEEEIEETLLQAGEIVYAQILTEANTDAPMPVLARVLSGPFSGGKLIGSFTEEKELILIRFDKLIMGDETIQVDGMALDPDTALPGMASDVDHHYLQRIFVPVAAAFVEGMADAIEQTGDTSITINTNTGTTQTDTEDPDTDQEIASGISEAGQELGKIIDEMNEDLEVTVRLNAGTTIGVLFVEPVMSGGDSF